MAREPPAEARIEIVAARLCELFVKAWGGKGMNKASVTDYLPYLRAWAIEELSMNESRYSEVDREVLTMFKG